MRRDTRRRQPRRQRVAARRADPRGHSMNGISQRVAAASGAYFVVAVMAGSVGDRNTVGVVVIVSGLVAFAAFLGHLHRLLAPAPTRRDGSGVTATCCGVVVLAVQAGELATVSADHYLGTAGPHRLLEVLGGAAFVVTTLFFGLFVLAASVSGQARRLLPAGLGWAGIAAGALTAVAGVAGSVNLDAFIPWPYLGALVWTFAVSVLLAVRPVPAPVAPAPTREAVAGAM